jgi:hypothetical protein
MNREAIAEKKRDAYRANPEPHRRRKLAWYHANAEAAREAAKVSWSLKTPDEKLAAAKVKLDGKYRKVHGLSLELVEQMHRDQEGLCAICKKQMNPVQAPRSQKTACTAPMIDHCHSSGVIRGLLCNHCNRGLGLFLDNADALRAAADYIDRGRARAFPKLVKSR